MDTIPQYVEPGPQFVDVELEPQPPASDPRLSTYQEKTTQQVSDYLNDVQPVTTSNEQLNIPKVTFDFIWGFSLGTAVITVLMTVIMGLICTLTSSWHIILGYFAVVVPYRRFTIDLGMLYGMLKVGIAGGIVYGFAITIFLAVLGSAVLAVRIWPLPEPIGKLFERLSPGPTAWMLMMNARDMALDAFIVPLGVATLQYLFGQDAVDHRVADHQYYAVCAGTAGWVIVKIKGWLKTRGQTQS